MVRVSVSMVLFLFGYTFGAPVPDKAKVAVIRDSTIGLALAAGASKTFGILEGNRDVHVEKERKEGEKRPDFSVLEKVNFGAAFAVDKSISIGVIKNNIFSGKNPFEGLKFK